MVLTLPYLKNYSIVIVCCMFVITRLDSFRRVQQIAFISIVFSMFRGKGRAIAQAVSRRLPTAAAQVETRVWSCGIL
jgi:hypothetical protein